MSANREQIHSQVIDLMQRLGVRNFAVAIDTGDSDCFWIWKMSDNVHFDVDETVQKLVRRLEESGAERAMFTDSYGVVKDDGTVVAA